jgi:hypothetical protein
MTTLEPIKAREPFFDGWETDKVTHTFSCHACGAEVSVGFGDMHHAAWGWRERTEPQLRSSLATHFGIDLTNKYIGDGMDAVVVAHCPKCGGKTYLYFWFHEYRHSCYQISLRGAAADDT